MVTVRHVSDGDTAGTIFRTMGEDSVAEAKNRLSEPIDRALKRAGVVIRQHGHPLAELRLTSAPAKPITSEAIDWLAERRVGGVYHVKTPLRLSAGRAMSGKP
jgi:antitoxin (DNA-binding transcriptional repressor) of toxin-antitoxin stability system